ncbi:MAG: PepSY domain-containing protein [Cyclobacteriaceae bacterium]|nr:PepSY domain-containing protein [Cyclobacteriaceae bacterium HetDA_MAG_MS6]
MFATITGVLIHWRNLLTKMYAFVKAGKWKIIWTNAHTVLGVIGLPFQVMYAVTGAFFCLLTLILLPSVFLLYDGDTDKLFAKVQPQQAISVDKNAPDTQHLSINELYQQVRSSYPNHDILRVQLRNYGKTDAVATWQLDDQVAINSIGVLTMKMSDGKILDEYSVYPSDKPYSNTVTDFIFKLHFANFGGLFIKILYFLLSMITCFMIISGVLTWRTARDNKQYSYSQKLFHHRVTKAYLAICLSMFPAFAILFITNKVISLEMESRVSLVNTIFFVSWLGLTTLGLFWDSYAKQNRNYLIYGGVLSLLIPIVNGVSTGDWFWSTWQSYSWVASIDIFWLVAGLTSLYLSIFILKIKPGTNKPEPLKKVIEVKEQVNETLSKF